MTKKRIVESFLTIVIKRRLPLDSHQKAIKHKHKIKHDKTTMQFFLPAPCNLHGNHNTGIHISAKGFQGFLHTINNVSVDFVRDKLLNFVKKPSFYEK